MIDTVSRLDELDDLIPAVLRIVARAVGADNCCLFVADHGETVRLRYWLREEAVYAGDAILSLLPGFEATARFALGGFAVPVELFGEPNARRTRAAVLDHRVGTALPLFDEWLRAYGRPYQMNVPLVVNGRFHGGLSIFRVGDPGDEFTPPQVAVAEAVARQLALAVETHRLADTVRRQAAEAAAAAERQRAADARAAELAAANEALRRITDRLGTCDDLSEFLAAALVEVCRSSGAKSAAVFVYDPAGHTLRKAAFVFDGRPREVDADPDLELWRKPVPADVTDCWERMLAGGQPVWTDLDDPPADQWSFAAGWHRRMGHRAMAAFLLRVGGHPVGFLRLCFPTPDRPTAGKLEECRALAQQAALALQMSHTAARARTAAVAVEQERAARERLGELAAANRMLVNSLDGFTVNPDPADFLGKVLMQLAGVLGVPVVELWHARDLSGLVYPGPMYHGGRVLTPEQADHPMRHTGYRVPTTYDLIDAVDRRRHVLWRRLADHPDVPERMWRWYRERFGAESMVNLPLVVGRRVLGAAVGFAPADHPLTDSQLELAHALATQLALALQLGELNDRGREMAVLAERARLARDIHDTLAQGFLGVILHLETARRALPVDLPRVVRAVDQAQALAQASLNEARRSVGMLRAKPADQGDLAVALSMLARAAAEQSPFPVRFETALATCPVPAAVAEQIERIAAEAVNNARRHARPSRVVVALTREGGQVRVTIADDGVGFDPAAVPPGRYGLVGMRERAAAAMCGLTVTSAPGRGTTVAVGWPDDAPEGGTP